MRGGGADYAVVLSGWKEIAAYLGCGVRTAQRWESNGLPVNRPNPGRRSHVLASTEQLDSWVRHGAFWRTQQSDVRVNIARARKLRAEIEQARRDLHLKVAALRKEIAALRNHRRKRPME